MRFRFYPFVTLAAVAASLSFGSLSFGEEPNLPAVHEHPIPASSRQLLVVRSANWLATSARLQRYERGAASPWRAVGEALKVNVGRHGMAWGRGLQEPEPGPIKREGDGRTPSGVFPVGTLFGYSAEAPADAAAGSPYIHIHAGTTCVEDPGSPLYNRIADVSPYSPMLRADGVFRLGFVIEQNAPEVLPGAGSCVFFHVQRGPAQATSGCTSTSLTELQGIVSWLKPDAKPTIVQLPESEYARLQVAWALPHVASEPAHAQPAE